MMVHCEPETPSLQVYCSNGKEVGYIQIDSKWRKKPTPSSRQYVAIVEVSQHDIDFGVLNGKK